MKRDKKALYTYLKRHHTGSKNAVICKQLQIKFNLSEAVIRRYVSVLRKEGIPICSCNFGYFYPETHLDVVDTVSRFNKYLLTLSATSTKLLSAAVKN